MRDWLFFKMQGLRRRLGLPLATLDHVVRYDVPPERADYGSSELAALYRDHKGRQTHKWTHFFDLYDRHFARFRGSPVRMLEIGVSFGGSLEVWRRYFGSAATIFGIDVDPACASRADAPNQVRIGSQDDPPFLRSVVEEMGGLDIVLDDGSHYAPHQMTAFKTLWPMLSVGGVYAIEDTHTSYYAGYPSGGYHREGTAVELAKKLIDDMHGWFHDRSPRYVPPEELAGLAVYDSIMFIDKTRRTRPQVVRIGAA